MQFFTIRCSHVINDSSEEYIDFCSCACETNMVSKVVPMLTVLVFIVYGAKPSYVTFLAKLFFLHKIEESVILHSSEQEFGEHVA